MKTQNLTTGQQFKNSVTLIDGTTIWFDKVYTIYQITDKRVCYTDGKSSYCGATNRNVKGSWLGIERFKKDVLKGKIKFI